MNCNAVTSTKPISLILINVFVIITQQCDNTRQECKASYSLYTTQKDFFFFIYIYLCECRTNTTFIYIC